MAGSTVSVPSAEMTSIFIFSVASGQPGGGGGMLGGGELRPRGRLGRCGKSTGPTLGGPLHRRGRQICATASAGRRTTRKNAMVTNLPALIINLSLGGSRDPRWRSPIPLYGDGISPTGVTTG